MATQQDTATELSHFNLDSYDNRRASIDHEISSLQARITEISRQRNALAPISKLHVEILSKIFLLCIESRETVTWVCHTWRSTAVNFPPLWTQIDLRPRTNEDRLAEVLARAKSHLLAVRYHRFFMRSLKETSGVLVPLRAERLRSLVLDAVHYPNIIDVLFTAAADNMEHLQVMDIISSPIHRSDVFLSASAPALTTLKLHDILLRPLINSPFLSSVSGTLTALHLSECPAPQKHMLLEILQKLPNLEDLSLQCLRLWPRHEDVASPESLAPYAADLRNLHKFTIEDDGLGGYEFLPFLYYPLSCYVKAEFDLLCDCKSINQLSFLFLNHIRIWEKDARDASGLHMRFNLVGKSLLLDLNIPGANRVTMSFDEHDKEIQYISELYRFLPSDHLRSVTYCGWESLACDIASCWLANLPHFALLEEMRLESLATHCPTNGIVHEEHQPRRRPISTPLFSVIPSDSFPKLRILSLASFILGESAIKDLCEWLEKRSALGVGVPHVTMLDCEIREGELYALRQNLGKVSLDESCEITEASM